MNDLINSIVSHWALSAGAGAVIARFLYLEINQWLPTAITQEEEKLLKEVVSKLTAHEDIAYFKATLTWIDAKIPNAGDQKYSIAAAFIVAQNKNLQPYQTQIAALLSAIGNAAKQGIENGNG